MEGVSIKSMLLSLPLPFFGPDPQVVVGEGRTINLEQSRNVQLITESCEVFSVLGVEH